MGFVGPVGKLAKRGGLAVKAADARESVMLQDGLGLGVVPDPGLATFNWFRQWVGIYQLIDRLARARGGSAAERPLDERMIYIARGLMRYNTYAQGMVTALRVNVLGARGFQHQCVGPSAKQAQRWLDRWMDEHDWWAREREIYERSHVDGEAIPRFFAGDGTVHVRMIEPEWVIAPDGTVEWMFGFRSLPHDVETVTELYALYGEDSEYVPAEEFYHVKNVGAVKADKRGRSDFLASAQVLDNSFKVWRNFTDAEAVRQAITYFTKQPQGVTASDLGQAIAAEADYTPPLGGATRGQPPIKLQWGSGVEHLLYGQDLAAPPGAPNVQGTMSGVNAAMLAAGRKYQMPLVLITGDMGANNTLDFGDESPFGMVIGDEQNVYSRHVRNILWRVIEFAVEDGQLEEEVLFDGTDLLVYAERKPAKDSQQNTQRAKTLYDDGVISGRERSSMEGVEYDEQQAERQREGLLRLGQQKPQEAFESVEYRTVDVHRDGKVFQRRQRVSVSPDDAGGVRAVKKMAKKATDPVVQDYLESALHNARHDDEEDVAAQLGSMYAMAHEKGHADAADHLATAFEHVGAELYGEEPGEAISMENKYYESQKGLGTGDDVEVVRQPVVRDGKVLVKGAVKRAASEATLVEKEVTVHRGGKTFSAETQSTNQRR